MNWTRVEGVLGTENLARLAQKRVAIVGLGSGGGLVALNLAMSGVGKFVLVDDDILEEGNVVRHVADRRYVGRPKVDAVAELIRYRNPNTEIEICEGRIEENRDILEGVDLLVSAVDGEPVKFILNQLALALNLPAVYAGVYERGEGGDAAIIYPYDGPCYACWAAALRDDVARQGGSGEDLDYGMIGPGGTLEAEPGLWLHVMRVATVQAHIILNELLKGTEVYEPMPGNTIIMANNTLEIMTGQANAPQTALWVTIARDPECLVCGDRLHNEAALQDSDGKPKETSLESLMEDTGIVMQEEDED